jgi:hypothetical protein
MIGKEKEKKAHAYHDAIPIPTDTPKILLPSQQQPQE